MKKLSILVCAAALSLAVPAIACPYHDGAKTVEKTDDAAPTTTAKTDKPAVKKDDKATAAKPTESKDAKATTTAKTEKKPEKVSQK